jgi:hypothetical protein
VGVGHLQISGETATLGLDLDSDLDARARTLLMMSE